MSYLQQPNFLDTFPNRENIIPSFYSIPGETNGVWGPGGVWNGYVTQGLKPRYCDRIRAPPAGHQATECCYVCLIPPTAYTSVLPLPNVRMGMIGHYYMIDARFGPIIHKGFPMKTIYSGMADIKDAEGREVYEAQLDAYFPAKYPDDAPAAVRLAAEGQPPPLNYKFSRHDTQYDTTYPYIFCFTTCCLTSGCSSFEFFLEPDRYKKTFWCQGFRDFTALMSPDPATSPVLSPVLHVVIGSMLTEPDFYLLSLRYNILNVEPLKSYRSANPRIDEYRKSTQVLMTLGTKEEDRSIYQPSIDPYPRSSAIQAFKSLRDKVNQVNIQYKRRLFPLQPDNVIQQRSLVRDKVQRKIEMIKVIAAVAHNTSQTGPGGAGIRVIDTLIQGARGYGVDPAGFRAQVTALRTKIGQLLTLQVTQAPKLRNDLQSYMYNMLPLPDAMETPNPEAIPPDGPMRTPYKDAINFIMASPSAAATAVIQYLSSQILLNGLTEFEEDLTDYALLCLKKNWLGGIMNNAYEADTTVFGEPVNRKLYYFNTAGEFVFMGIGNFTCLDPSNPMIEGRGVIADLYVHKSSFDEVKREAAAAPTPQNPTVDHPVTVLTLANIYRLDCYYKKIPGNIVKSMSIVYQVSSTIVHTRDLNPEILQAMDMQKIPLSFLPDLPEVLRIDNLPDALRGDNSVKPFSDSDLPLITRVKPSLQQGMPLNQAFITNARSEGLSINSVEKALVPPQRRKPSLTAKQRAEAALPVLQQQRIITRAARRGKDQGLSGGTPGKRNLIENYQREQEDRREQEHRNDLQEKDRMVNDQLKNNLIKDMSLFELEKNLEPFLAGNLLYSLLCSEYTSCATHRRVASYGGFFAGKMMDYFFSTYMQLPSFFKYFESYLKICIQYNTTALIYDANVPPYNLIELQRPAPPGAPPPPPPSFTLPFVQHFQKMKIVLVPGSAADGSGNEAYIRDILREKTADIKSISDFLTKDFMIDEGADDNIQNVVDHFSQPSGTTNTTQSNASLSTASSTRSEIFCSFDVEDITNSDALCIFLLERPLEKSECGDDDYQHLSEDEEDDNDDNDDDDDRVIPNQPLDKRNEKKASPPPGVDGGNKPRLTTVATTKRNRKYKSRSSPKRKSKSNNKSKSRHKRNSKITNKTFCRKRKSYLSRKPFKKQTLRKGVKR